MESSVEAVSRLIEELGATDFNLRAKALAELVRHGRAATHALLAKLPDADPRLRMLAIRALAEIADPSSADALAAALDDGDERVRAYAAHGLARMKDDRALEALVHTFDDFPDVLRDPSTPSADALIDIGRPALPRIAPLLSAADPTTRVRAFFVLRAIVAAMPDVGSWPVLWRSLGSYDPASAEGERDAAARQWRDWIAGRGFAR